MTPVSGRLLYWAPRALSVLFIGFLSLFALDVFSEGLGFWQTAQALAVHLVPSFVLMAVLALAWRWEWVGALCFGAAGAFYVWVVVSMSRPVPTAMRLLWMATIAGPAFVIAGLFLLNWVRRGHGPLARDSSCR
jgi:hypothetical protein